MTNFASDVEPSPSPHLEALTAAISTLHQSAGLPSARKISSMIKDQSDFPDTVSHETVASILKGESLKNWMKLHCVVRQLAEMAAHKPEPDTVVVDLQALWLAARLGTEVRPDQLAALGSNDPTLAPKGAANVLVDRELAQLSYDDGVYICRISREVRNGGSTPIIQFPVKIRVDRYPEDLKRSEKHHHQNPLTWQELAFEAKCAGRHMSWRPCDVNTKRGSERKLNLLFENAREQFPLLPDEETALEYEYCVRDVKWGTWFARSIRHETKHLTISVELPASMRPVVSGTTAPSVTADALRREPVPQCADSDIKPGRARFEWIVEKPIVGYRYRLEWGFKNPRTPWKTVIE